MTVASDTRARPFVFTFGNTNTNSAQNLYHFDAAIPRQLSPSFPYAASLEDASLPLDQVPELMNPETHWASAGQLTPKSVGRVTSHYRGSSLSSLGSAGPASPYTQTTSNPRIAITDSAIDGLPDIAASDIALYSAAPKPIPGDRFYPQYPSYGRMSRQPTDFDVSAAHNPRSSRGLLPGPEFPIGNGRSNPVSVASSITSESPATPLLEEPEFGRGHKAAFGTAPKLDRTMTDVYEDGLYNPDMTITSAPPHTTSAFAYSTPTSHDMFAQRLHAANNQHLSAVHPQVSTISRERSPFRHGSPLAPVNPPPPAHSSGRYTFAQQVRERQQAEEAAEMLRHQMASQSHDTEMSSTISPQDSLLEFQEQEGDTNFPLFPPQSSQENHFGGSGLSNSIPHTTRDLEPSIASHDSSHLQYMSHPAVPQHYPFVVNTPTSAPMTDMPANNYSNMSSPQKPSGVNADGGTYTCTYHGCTLRFETPALLQKHKREGHRQVHGLAGSRRPDSNKAAAMLNSQAGPHKCERINPSTGKPCNTIFSRPYDLTRHEDTIHNAKKQKVRCNLCTEEKTFSRADALTRHYRVCHPEVEFPGKHRRRRGSVSG